MGLYNGAVITSAGQNLLAQAISGTELTWTAMRASSVAIPEGTDLTTLTALTGIEQATDITDASVYGSNVVQVSARFSNTGIDTAYLMETIGIYGQVTGGSETLIAVMTAETPDEMPVYDQDSPSAFIFNVQMSVQNANTITMVVNDTGTATVADLKRKVDLNGGDLSDTVVDTFTASTASYPVPAAGDTMKVIGGKIMKFCADIVQAFTGASASAAGKKGLVPAPAAGRNTYYLRGDGTWQAPVNGSTATAAGFALDARQANPNVSGSLGAQLKSLNDSLNAIISPNAGSHNSFYRGASLGSSLTSGQSSAIRAGTFENLYIGDYWTINGVNWRIAHFDYWYQTGDTNCNTHHVVVVPDSVLYEAQMNETNITTGAYIGSKMYTANLATAKSAVIAAFGSGHILTHRSYMANAVTNGYPSARAWYDSQVDLMTEEMVYGCPQLRAMTAFASGTNTVVPTQYRVENRQLRLFALDPQRIVAGRRWWWLRDVVNASSFAAVPNYGHSTNTAASNSTGVRPAIAIY